MKGNDGSLVGSAKSRLTPGKAVSLLWESAWESLLLAFLIHILGGVAFAMVGNVWGRMTPTLPPGLSSAPGEPAYHFGAVERFKVISGVVFATMATGRLLRFSRAKRQRSAGIWLSRITDRAAQEWFQLLVVNAFIASIMVSVFAVTNRYTPLKMVWQALAGVLQPVFEAMMNLLPSGMAGTTRKLWDWFGANQLKFSFWLLYLGAICDDLGLPNYKTLWRRLRRWWNSRNQPGGAKSPVTNSVEGKQ